MNSIVFFGFVLLASTGVTNVAGELKLYDVVNEILSSIPIEDIRPIVYHSLVNKEGIVSLKELSNSDFIEFISKFAQDAGFYKDAVDLLLKSDINSYIYEIFNRDISDSLKKRDPSRKLFDVESKILEILNERFDDCEELRSFGLQLRSRENRDLLKNKLESDYGKRLRSYIYDNYLRVNFFNKLRYLLN